MAEDATVEARAEVGRRIARQRRRRGLSQVVLAGLVGRSESWLSQVVRHEVACDEWYSSKEGRLMSTV